MSRTVRKFKRRINHPILKIYNYLISSLINIGESARLPLSIKLCLINAMPERPIICVPTESIRFFVPNKFLEEIFSPHEVTKSKIPSFIFKGDWDKNKMIIDEHYSNYNKGYRTIHQIFVDGKEFHETDEYKILLKKINKWGKSPRGKTIEELNLYFESLIQLKKLIQEHGYKSQIELNGNKKDEIGVFIGRKGEIIKAEDNFSGTHRFALAKLLNIQKIPVHILAVHEKWAYANNHLLGKRNIDKLEKYFQ
ncbi:MAG: hypothetical protein JJU28_19535 [Cyclobacteriaceae bacterium]|nr:hypothetical protein [Cyclobacteriaceae bacterium]